MKDVIVLSRNKAKQYSAMKNIDESAIISINSCGDYPNRFFDNPKIKHIAHWEFDDTEMDDFGITQQQANQIAEFVKRYEDDVDTIVVHCDAGISRSAGIGAAILFYKYGDDSQIFEDGTYSPNMRCYKSMLKAFGFDFGYETQKDIDEKFIVNTKAWVKINL